MFHVCRPRMTRRAVSPSRGQDHLGSLCTAFLADAGKGDQMVRNFYYRREGDAVDGSANFAALLVSEGTSLGITAAQSTAYGVVNTALQAAWTTAVTPETRTKISVEAKN